MKVTEENMGSVFNDSIYPVLNKSETIEDVVSNIKGILKDYSFEDEKMQARFLIPCLDAFGEVLQKEIGIEELTPEIRAEIGWFNIQNWFNEGNFIPMKLVNYADLLNCEAKEMWKTSNTIEQGIFDWVKNEAKLLIEMVENKEAKMSAKQKNHLKRIIDDKVPFGLKIK